MNVPTSYLAVVSNSGAWGSAGTVHAADSAAEVPPDKYRRWSYFKSVCGLRFMARYGDNKPWDDVMMVERCASCDRIVRGRRAKSDDGPGSPCPHCDQGSVVDDAGCCIHCGAPRPIIDADAPD